MRYLSILLLLAGCAGQPNWRYTETPDWKPVKTEVFVVARAAPWCENHGELGCARRNHIDNTCTIFVGSNVPDWVMPHELKHCEGFDHY
jgi:hypothetical protein